jgi:Spy/CpxP family protein refolding chaperone
VAVLLGVSVPAQAQTGGSPTQSGTRQRGGGKLRQLIQQLNLTAEQRSQMRSLRSMPKGKERRQAFMKLLTSDQRSQLRTLMKQNGMGRGRNRGSSTTTDRGGPPSTTF